MKNFVVVILALAFANANAKDLQKKNIGQGLEYATDEQKFEDDLNQASVEDIRRFARKLNKDLKEAESDVEKMIELGGILDDNFQPKPEFMGLSFEFMSKFADVEIDLENLPPLPDNPSDWVLLKMCIEEAKKTDYNTLTDPVDFMNAVFHAVLQCASGGLGMMADFADITDLDDSQLTEEILGNRLFMMEKVAHEMAHLAKFTSGFITRVMEQGLSGDKNKLVGLEDDSDPHPTGAPDHTSKPRPSIKPSEDDKPEPRPSRRPINENDSESDKRLLERVLSILTKRKGPKKNEQSENNNHKPSSRRPHAKGNGQPKPTAPPTTIKEEADVTSTKRYDAGDLLVLRILNILRSKKGPRVPKPTAEAKEQKPSARPSRAPRPSRRPSTPLQNNDQESQDKEFLNELFRAVSLFRKAGRK